VFIHLICDYGIGDPAFAEVIQRLKGLDPKIDVFPTSVPAFSTLATGFWIGQFSLNDPFPSMAIYSNTAPRKDSPDKRDDNEGEKLMYAILDNNVPIMAINAGFCFSFVRKRIKKFCQVKIAHKGSQFRSRDYFPQAVVGILKAEKKYIGDELSTDSIPHVPKNKICFIDGYGNLKTTFRFSDMTGDLAPGDKVKIKIGRDVRMAIYSDGIFSVKEGELSFAPGSSGTSDDRFMEILLRGDSAWRFFGKPEVGTEFSFEKKASFLGLR